MSDCPLSWFAYRVADADAAVQVALLVVVVVGHLAGDQGEGISPNGKLSSTSANIRISK